MLTAPQIRTIKMAQRQAGLPDADYREALATATGLADCTSSKDRRLGDEHFDRVLSYLEAIYWRSVHLGTALARRRSDPFQTEGYWAAKNQSGNTSRDRHTDRDLQAEISRLESFLQLAGKGGSYLAAIRAKTGEGWPYLAALRRTVKAASAAAQERLSQATADVNHRRNQAAQRAGGVRVYELKR